ncbi:MAG: peptidoglycan recognition family protein [Candidatus Pacearchaeota archaeon]|jgi:N-acetyl-anhydromuramyl-L-alanine amidase AmpD
MEFLEKINFIVIHHSGSLNSYDAIKDFHVNTRGWEDIGYHWLIDKNGKLLKGRSEEFIGAHCLGHNRNSIAVCMIGDFEFIKPTEKQMKTLIKFLKEKLEENNLYLKNILGHREVGEREKICPGKNINLNELREKLKQ